MTPACKMLLESLVEHLSLLKKTRPKEAASPVARRAEQYVRMTLRQHTDSPKRLAA